MKHEKSTATCSHDLPTACSVVNRSFVDSIDFGSSCVGCHRFLSLPMFVKESAKFLEVSILKGISAVYADLFDFVPSIHRVVSPSCSCVPLCLQNYTGFSSDPRA